VWERTLHKLSAEDRERIVQLHRDGVTASAIAKRFGVSDGTVSRILGGEGKLARSEIRHGELALGSVRERQNQKSFVAK
jgi:transposase-like protein